MEIVDLERLSKREWAELEGDEDDPFDDAGMELSWRPKERHVALRAPDGSLVAAAGLTIAQLDVDGRRIAVVGLGSVIVNAAHRGQGHGRRIVEAALDRAGAMGPQFMILFCHSDRAGLYSRLGFTEITSTVTVDQPDGELEIPMLTMWRALQPGACWPDGPVRLDGLPF